MRDFVANDIGIIGEVGVLALSNQDSITLDVSRINVKEQARG
jgi:hypothetical protein